MQIGQNQHHQIVAVVLLDVRNVLAINAEFQRNDVDVARLQADALFVKIVI
jgi:hypothetical protein